jgi:hypothetical protein
MKQLKTLDSLDLQSGDGVGYEVLESARLHPRMEYLDMDSPTPWDGDYGAF